MPWGVGMRDMLALSIHCQTNNYRGTSCWEKSKSWIEKQMFIIYSIFLKFTINSWRDICLSLLFVYHILGGTENHMRILLLFFKIFHSSIYCYTFESECFKWACTYKNNICNCFPKHRWHYVNCSIYLVQTEVCMDLIK